MELWEIDHGVKVLVLLNKEIKVILYFIFYIFYISIYIYIDRMPKLSTPMMIGIGAVILIVIVIIILKPWDDGTVPEVDAGVDASENDSIVSCSTFVGCPDDMEINPDANGESESECCQKKTCESNGIQCSTSACSSSEGCWDPLPGARGDSEEECCVKALCTDDKCDPGYKLRERHPDRTHEPNSGRSNSDCCEEKPRCSPNICAIDGYESKSPRAPPKGDTLHECCNLKYCWAASDNDLPEDLSPPTCEGSNDGVATCSGNADENGDPCVLNATRDDCAVRSGSCVFSAGAPCALNADGSGCVVEGGNCVYTPGQTTEANGWNDEKCGDTTLGGGDGLEQVKNDDGAEMGQTIRGNTKDLCCQPKTCHVNGWVVGGSNANDCDDGYKPTEDANVRGDDKSTCCVQKTCGENEWDDDQCRIQDTEKPSAKTSDTVGDSVNECCESRLCSDYYFNGEMCDTHKGGIDYDGAPLETSSDCFTVANQYPGQEIDSDGQEVPVTNRKLKENCAFYNRTLVSGSVKVPGTTDVEVKKNTCCIPKKCGDFEDMAVGSDGDGALLKDICEDGSEFSPTSDIPLEPEASTGGEAPPQGEEALRTGCCSALTCAEDYPLPERCKEEFDEADPTPTALGDLAIGTGFDSDNLTIDLTKREQTSEGLGCCKPVTCGVAFPGDTDCVAIQTTAQAAAGGLKKKLSAANELVNGNGSNCCEAKKCSEVTFQCEDWSERIEPGPPEDASQETCCRGKLCTELDNPWTNAKCKDKNYTRASVRGKLISEGRIDGPNQEPDATAISEPSGGAGDVKCCEQDLTNNYARMCVGEEYYNNVRTNYSVGASIPQTIINSGSRERVSATECRRRCVTDTDCGSFGVYGNDGRSTVATEASPSCYKYRKWPSGTDIPSIVGQERHARPTLLHYVSGGNFPEEHRYSGAKKKTVTPRLTADGTDASKITRRDDGGGQWGVVSDWNRAGQKRNNATSMANVWKTHYDKRKDILLAGVDKDFCPIDNVKAYGTWRADNSHVDMGTWHPHNNSMPGIVQAGTTGLFNSSGAGKGNSNGSGRNKAGCTTLPVNNALDDCYRNLRCGANWIGGANQTDNHSSKIAGQSLINLTSHRRICPKGPTVKSSNQWPRLIDSGGAFVHPTRIYNSPNCSASSSALCVGSDNDTVRYGVMPHKARKSGEVFWDGTLLPGDSWNDMNVNTNH